MASAASRGSFDDADRGQSLLVTLFALSQAGLLNLHFTLAAAVIFGTSLLILVQAGLLGQAFDTAPESVWIPAMMRPEMR